MRLLIGSRCPQPLVNTKLFEPPQQRLVSGTDPPELHYPNCNLFYPINAGYLDSPYFVAPNKILTMIPTKNPASIARG